VIGHGACMGSIHPVSIEKRIEGFGGRAGLNLGLRRTLDR
jgi:hypothetical protein